MQHQNESVVRNFLEALMGGDMDAAADLAADDIVWRSAGRTALAGEYRGKAEVFEHFDTIVGIIGAEGVDHRVEFHDLLANDDHVVALWTRIAQRGSDRLEVNGVGVFHVDEGRVSEWWVIHADLYAHDEFFSWAHRNGD